MNEPEQVVPPSQQQIDDLLNPDVLSGKQIEIMRKLDEKNLDREDMEEILRSFLASYNAAKND